MIRIEIRNSAGDRLRPPHYANDQAQADAWIDERLGDVFGDDVVFSTEDISTEYANQQKVNRGIAAQTKGAEIIARVYALNEDKFEAGTLTAETFGAMMADGTISMIERMLKNGSLKTAKTLIQGMGTTYFSAEEKLAFIDMIDEYLESIA